MPFTSPVMSETPSEIIALADWLQGQAARIEQNRGLPGDVVERLAAADCFRMSQPVRYDGLGLAPQHIWRRVMELGRGCSSCAWVVGLVAANVLMLGKFSERAQRDVFECGKPAILPMLTGHVSHDVEIERVEGGISLSGNWRYASGIDNASWVGLLIQVPDEAGHRMPFVVLVEATQFKIDHASWNVVGMRGTGSKNIRLDKTFVPEHRFMSWTALQAGEKHPDCPNDEPIYSLPLNVVFAMSVAASTFGVASAVVDEFRSLARKRFASGAVAAGDDPLSCIYLASGEATMSMARDLLLQDAESILASCVAVGGPTLDERARARMRLTRSSEMVLQEAQRLFRKVGGSLLPQGSRIERLFRDLHAMSSHSLLQKDDFGKVYGRLLLDLELPADARI